MIVEVGIFSIELRDPDRFAPVADDIRRSFASGGIEGLRWFRMGHAVEDLGRWVVLVGWDSVEAHERFVGSREGRRQRALLANFIVGEPEVLHFRFDEGLEVR